ncbi:MAG: DNA repair protein RecO [Thermoanaerobaculia bacterium]
MPLVRAKAFVLSAIPLREKDRIVTILTEETGKSRVVARGARRLQSAFAGALEPMSEAEVLFFEKEGRDLHRLDSLELVRSSFPLASELSSALLLSALAESLITFVSDSDPSEKFFRLARHAMDALFSGARPRAVAVYFDAWVLRLSGVLPSPSACAVCGRTGLESPFFFEESLPGFLGRECARAGSKKLSRAASEGISSILSRPLDSLAVDFQALPEIGDVLGRVRRHFLGHELRSQRVLQQVW